MFIFLYNYLFIYLFNYLFIVLLFYCFIINKTIMAIYIYILSLFCISERKTKQTTRYCICCETKYLFFKVALLSCRPSQMIGFVPGGFDGRAVRVLKGGFIVKTLWHYNSVPMSYLKLWNHEYWWKYNANVEWLIKDY